MNRRQVVSLIALGSLAAMLASAAEKPNFTGSWKLNASKSDFGPVPPPEKLEQTINVTKRGQLGLGPVLDLYLRRIERDRSGLPVQLFPVRGDWKGLDDDGFGTCLGDPLSIR